MDIQALYSHYLKHPGVNIDSRKTRPGEIFIAIRGEQFDGNEFAASAIEKGASLAVVDDDKVIPEAGNEYYLLVDNALKALQDLAHHHRKNLDIPFFAITGSNGKTTTKELMSEVLTYKYNVYATPGNFNNHIGLPLSILQVTRDHDLAIIEMGANHQGELDMLCRITEPTHGLITNIGKDHLEGYGGWEGVIKAHIEFTDYFREGGGIFFRNASDPELGKITDGLCCVGYGHTGAPGADCRGEVLATQPFLKIGVHECLELEYRDVLIIGSRLTGKFHFENIMAAVAAGSYFNVAARDIQQAIKSYTPTNNRSQVIRWGTNTILLDAYNANPSSMSLALVEAASIDHPAKTVILGDMYELGKYSEREHRAIIRQLKEYDLDIVLIGKEFGKFKDELPCKHFNNVKEARQWFDQLRDAGRWFLIKGSRGMQLETLLSGKTGLKTLN